MMLHQRYLWIVYLAGLWLLTTPLAASGQEKPAVDFDRDVKPILAEHCLACHGADKPEGGLKLTERQTALAAADSGLPAIVPEKPETSELLRRVMSSDPSDRMPPEDHDPLSPADIAKLRQWIAAGAPWGGHWAYQPLVSAAPPNIRQGDWVQQNIDRFVLAELERRGLAPSPEADRYTLIRRLSYDLLGLPPTIAEVDTFVKDSTPTAYEDLVDRLLKSPHFGERWGRHWLDLAHYADSDGYEKDRARPDAYLFRDWVIDAINDDMPFDQFTIQQLAGDLLPQASARQKLATAFCRQSLTNEEGGVDQEEYRVAAVFDRTETVGTVWLGLTIGCARCHSHKYDPLPHDEYYKLFAFFNSSDERSSSLPVAAEHLEQLEEELRPLEQALADRYAALAPAELAWETQLHQTILAQANTDLKEHPLQVLHAESAASGAEVVRADSDVIHVTQASDRDTLTILAQSPVAEMTGIKLTVLPNDNLPRKGPGHAANGNFVLTGLRVSLVAEGQPEQLLELHRAQADYSQKGFSPDAVLRNDSSGKSGWAVAGKTGASHWIQFRTRGTAQVPSNAKIRLVLEQQHGQAHLLGHFKVAVLTGNARGLEVADKEVADSLEMYPEKRIAKTRQTIFDYYVHEVVQDAEVQKLRADIAAAHARHKARLMEVRTLGATLLPRTTHVFDRGDFLSKKQEVHPGTPGVLPPLRPRGSSADRLDLARWLVAPENFLTPRVAVNQVWTHLFGAGLVRTSNDFGVRGERPTHPALLDWLAQTYRDELHWSRKALIRRIVCSATYRQASQHRPAVEAIDPNNTLLHRQNRYRVEAEIIRDLHLAAAGLLSPKIGGPSVFPPMPEDLAKLSYANSFSWSNSAGEDRYRRGMYTFFKRTIPHPNLTTFDCPDANVACVTRSVSNTPLQALTLLNNETHVEAAQSLARRVLQSEAGNDHERLALAFRVCVARPPTEEEISDQLRLLSAARDYYRRHNEEADKLVGKSLLEGTGIGEFAAWITCARVVLNLDEFLTRE